LIGVPIAKAHELIENALTRSAGRKAERNEIRDNLQKAYVSKVVDDGLPPIVSLADFLRTHIEPEDYAGPIEACPHCGGELAEPHEIDTRFNLHFRLSPPCTCDQTEGEEEWRGWVRSVEERWANEDLKQKSRRP
jgi:hypothetical protein